MYRERVIKNLENARKNEKKEGPQVALFCLVAAALLGFNAYELLAKGRGIVPAFINAEVGGVLSAALCLLLAYSSVHFLISAIKNRKAGVTETRVTEYLNNVRALGTEDEIFARIESISPIDFTDGELRYDDLLIAGTSSTNVDMNFIYPISALCAAGTTLLGSQYTLYLHAVSDGKKHKYSYNTNEGAAEMVLKELEEIRPDLKIERAKPAK